MARWVWREEPLEHLALTGWPGITAWMTGRRGGVSLPPFATLNLSYTVRDLPPAVDYNRRRAVSLGAGRRPLWARLEHGARVCAVDRSTVRPPVADGLVTNDPTVLLAVTAADCLPIFLAAPDIGWIGVVHAGWRGTVRRVAAAGVAALAARGADPGRMLAALGPGIGPCCYRVGDDVVQAVRRCPEGEDSLEWRDGQAHLDLWAMNRAQLVAGGMSPDRMETAALCTACHTERFFSHRRERRTGRMGGFLCLATP